MRDQPHDLELPVLLKTNRWALISPSESMRPYWSDITNLEPLVLQHLLDRDLGSGRLLVEKFGLEDDTKGAIANDFAVGVSEITGIARLAILRYDLDDFAGIVDSWSTESVSEPFGKI